MTPPTPGTGAGLKESIIALLRSRGNRVLTLSDIHERLAREDAAEDSVRRVVGELERDGIVIAVRGKRYSLLEFTPYHAGRLRVHSSGYGVLPNEPESDIYVDRRQMHGAMNGDLVVVRVNKHHPQYKTIGKRRMIVGEVSQVLRRAHRTIVGRFHAGTDEPYVVPFDQRIDTDVLIDADDTMDAREGEMVNVEIDRFPDRSSSLARGRVIEVLGFIGDPGVDIEVVIRKLDIPHEFPFSVLAEARAIPAEIPPEEIARRTDLRQRRIVTIDGETARDFDDAVEVMRHDNGHYTLGVHIADVSHYVQEGSPVDLEALERGTSVYFPGRAVPMLPEELSNGICSLNPKVDRLAFSVELEIDAKGRVLGRRFYRSVIRTSERMTYTNVRAIFTLLGLCSGDWPAPAGVEIPPDSELRRRYEYLFDEFRKMYELYDLLQQRREQRGSIDFDLPEAEVLLTAEGTISGIRPTERNDAHRLIEEFMLAANEAVARELVLSNRPGIFRVHEPPDPQKLTDLKDLLKEFKLMLRGDPEQIRPAEIQRVLHSVTGTPGERFLTNLVLRAMKRAYYSEENRGHFALALEHYCHFTSPIRRYPDLVVHRRLAELLSGTATHGEELGKIEASLPLAAAQSSERERRAEETEREVLEWKKVIFMRDKVGLEFTGLVTGVAPFGLFVELDEIFVTGLVPVATIGGEFWQYREREHRLRGEVSGRELRLGDEVRIQVKSIDEDRHHLEFRLIESSGVAVPPRSSTPR